MIISPFSVTTSLNDETQREVFKCIFSVISSVTFVNLVG